MRPRIFIGSSVEGLEIAYALQASLEHDAEPTVWPQGIFEPTSTPLNDLQKTLDENDYAVFVFSPDDVINIRNQEFVSVRDNVIFEFGLFIGRLGKERVFFIIPRDVGEIHLPSDLIGVKPLSFISKGSDGNIKAALGPAVFEILTMIKKRGCLSHKESTHNLITNNFYNEVL